MEKLLKYYLSFLLLISLSCKNENLNEGSSEDSKLIAKDIWDTENSKHGFNGSFQGTPKAMTLLDKIIALDSTNADALREISVPFLKRGIPLEWKARFDKAVKHDPATWVPWRGYLYLWFYRDYEKAIADFNASDSITPYLDYPQGHSVYFWRGIAYLGAKDYDNSIAYWDKHITKETEDSGEDWVELEAFLYRGIAYYEAGNIEKANENFEKVIQYFTNSADAKYYKAQLLLNKGNKKAAMNMIDDAIVDFNNGYYNNRGYVETLRQIYLEDLEELKSKIIASN
ncbi:tetratricopeptide repeat protein [Maribacter sp. 1_MG-2023]|uniref:tetratricopeptide repeat protein n=1 Tax=Maribacter sp. 1_MG-2023 TaxID=3062677 RepID=UPI0026E142D7|nr:tetratricopeptide repeat protein [Maribacter sp. 1_MG-2023]MDO6470852.1 tetratricopeptide repeat protein [Maribacter sp. 1_MG-2023]